MGSPENSSISTKVIIVIMTAVLYAVGKGITAFIPTPWGVGQLLIGVFLPAFFAVVSETLPVAVGAGLGTFLGDWLLLTPLGLTTPVLSLVAGVPANFVGILLLGWFVKRYRTWGAFVAASISFVTLGNLIAAVNVVLFLSLPTALVLGLTVFWNTTSIPAILVGVPILVRAVRPLFGRSRIISNDPGWGAVSRGRQTVLALAFAVLFLVLGVVFFVAAPPSTIATWPGLSNYFILATAVVIIFAPITGIIAGSKLRAS